MNNNFERLCEKYLNVYEHKKHENMCVRCGRCCLEKVTLPNKKMLVTEKHCPGYDKVNKRCRIYENRFYLARKLYNVNCSTVEHSIATGQHPQDCPYSPPDYKDRLIYG